MNSHWRGLRRPTAQSTKVSSKSHIFPTNSISLFGKVTYFHQKANCICLFLESHISTKGQTVFVYLTKSHIFNKRPTVFVYFLIHIFPTNCICLFDKVTYFHQTIFVYLTKSHISNKLYLFIWQSHIFSPKYQLYLFISWFTYFQQRTDYICLVPNSHIYEFYILCGEKCSLKCCCGAKWQIPGMIVAQARSTLRGGSVPISPWNFCWISQLYFLFLNCIFVFLYFSTVFLYILIN